MKLSKLGHLFTVVALLFVGLLLWHNEPASLRSLIPSRPYTKSSHITKPVTSLKPLPSPETGIVVSPSILVSCQSSHRNSIFLTSTQEVQEVTLLNFDGDTSNEMVVLFTEEATFEDSETGLSGSIFTTFVEVFRCYESGIETISSFEWGYVYRMACFAEVSIENLTYDNREQLLLSAFCGSGGFLDFLVLGYVPGNGMTILFERGRIHSGFVENRNGQLTFGICDSGQSVSWDGNAFSSVDFVPAAIKPDVQIVYYWLQEGIIHTDLPDNTITVKRGQSFQLVRDHNRDDTSNPICYEGINGLRRGTPYVFTAMSGYQATTWLYPYENYSQATSISVIIID